MQDAEAPPGSERASFGSIVAGTDLSGGSDELIRAAVRVAARPAAPLHVVHALDVLPGAGGPGGTYDEQVRHAERLLDERIRDVVPAGVAVHRHAEGSVSAKVTRRAPCSVLLVPPQPE